MARAQSIAPFPADIDRDYFAAYLSGFTDGEGYFQLGFVRQAQGACRSTPVASFTIGLRQDDATILEQIQSFWGCGRVHRRRRYDKSPTWNPTVVYTVYRIREVASVVVPHFERYPLLAKKRRDFVTWKEGVSLVRQVVSRGRAGSRRTWTDSEITRFAALHATLKDQRKYDPPPPVPPPADDDDFPLFHQ